MKKGCLLLGIFLLLSLVASQTVSAEKIYDEWLPYHDFFTIGEDYYEVTNAWIYSGDDITAKTLIRKNDKSYILSASVERFDEDADDDEEYYISSEDCVKEGLLSFCINNVSLSPDNGARADEFGTYHFGTRIIIYEETPDTALLTVDHDLSDSTIYFGDEKKVTVIITNEGSMKATDIVINETVGEGLVITRHDGFDARIGSRLTRSISKLYPDDELVLRYWVKPDEYVNSTNLDTFISYNSPDNETAKDSHKVTIPWPLTASLSISPTNVKTGENSILSLKLTNDEDKDLEVVATVDIPRNLRVADKDKFSFNGHQLIYSGVVPFDDSMTLSPEFYSSFTGSYKLPVLVNAFVNGKEISWLGEKTLTVKNDKVTPNIVSSKTKMRAGEPLTLGVYLRNEDDDVPFYSVAGTFSSDFFTESFSLERIIAGDTQNPIFKTFHAPDVSEQTTFPLTVNGSFVTKSGERFTFSTQEDIIVLPENQSVVLTRSISKDVVNRTGEFAVTVSAENIADKGTYVITAFDEMDDDLDVIFGKTSADVALVGGEKRQLYVYKVRVPGTFSRDNLTVTSILNVRGSEVFRLRENVSVVGDIVVPVADGDSVSATSPDDSVHSVQDENVSGSADGSDADSEVNNNGGSAFPETKKSGFSRLIEGIVSFFSGLFG